MAHAVKVTTPIPSLEEFGERLGLSKARRKSLDPIFVERRPEGDYAVRRPDSNHATGVFSTQREAIDRARELNPNGRVLVERVRDTAMSPRDKWRSDVLATAVREVRPKRAG